MPKSDYKRLPGRGYGLGSYGSLWLGKDHILMASSNSFTESYKRFDFRDIRAITVTLSNRRLILNIIFGAFAAIILTLAFLVTPRDVLPGMLLLASPFLILILVNSLKGRACTCYINTAVQREKLRSLSRVKRANRVLDELSPLILAAQERNKSPADPRESP